MKHIFTPRNIGQITLKNRLIMPAMHLNLCPEGTVTQQFTDFYSLRAQGGVGLIIIGGCGIDNNGIAPAMIQLNADSRIPALRKLTTAVQAYGTKIFAQLYHAGRYSHSKVSGFPPVAPSPIASKLTGEVPKELTLMEIDDIISKYAQAAVRAKAAGFDGVEILAGAGYLISQFLSPLTNQRRDKYGGSAETRLNFGREVVQAVRQAVDPNYPIMVRVAGNDFMPAGNTLPDTLTFCRTIQQAGADAINVTGGWHETKIPQITMNVPAGTYTYLAKAVKAAVSIPVVACNRLNDYGAADALLADEVMDFIGIARPLLADPNLPLKLAKGYTGHIRPCIGCNQGCLDHVFAGKPVRCVTNPADDSYSPTPINNAQMSSEASNKKILVIGAGLAGLEFARVAQTRGHQVTLWEANLQLGGQLHLAAAPPGRADFLRLIPWYQAQLQQLGATVVLGKKATATDILTACAQAGFTHVVLATGAKPKTLPVTITPDIQVAQAWSVLAGSVLTGQRVVIVGGGAVGVETALYLAQKGTINGEMLRFLLMQEAEDLPTLKQLCFSGSKDITMVEMTPSLGQDMGSSTRWSMLSDLTKFGVKVMTDTTVDAIDHQGVHVTTAGKRLVLPCDSLVLAIGAEPDHTLHQQLSTQLQNVHLIGDAWCLGKVSDAILAGYNLAKSL